MTRISKSTTRSTNTAATREPGSDRWLLHDAKTRFSELVRRVQDEGPQHVVVHGSEPVVVISAREFHRLKGDITGEALIAAMRASPYREIEIEPPREAMPVRSVVL